MTEAPNVLGPIFTSVASLALTDDDWKRLASPAVGGVVLFARNIEDPEQVRNLAAEIKSLRDPSLLVTVDQEGGRVQRLRGCVTELPPASAYGAIHDQDADAGIDAAELGGMLMALEARSVGADLSFAPVLDVSAARSEVIGDRAFHSDPETVSIIAESWVRGMQRAGMRSVGKHFPGHGGVSGDSHVEAPEDERAIQEVMESDLMPYRRLGNRLDAVMTAHVTYPNITAAIPTYSAFWLEHMLREVLVFHGSVFSDDLSMAGALEAGEAGARALTALSSGCDFALICQSLDETDQAISELMANRELWTEKTWALDRLRPEPADEDCDVDACRDELLELLEKFEART